MRIHRLLILNFRAITHLELGDLSDTDPFGLAMMTTFGLVLSRVHEASHPRLQPILRAIRRPEPMMDDLLSALVAHGPERPALGG